MIYVITVYDVDVDYTMKSLFMKLIDLSLLIAF